MDGERFLSRGVGAATCKNGGKTVGTGKKEAPPNQAAKKNTENSTGKSGKFEKKKSTTCHFPGRVGDNKGRRLFISECNQTPFNTRNIRVPPFSFLGSKRFVFLLVKKKRENPLAERIVDYRRSFPTSNGLRRLSLPSFTEF